MGPHPLPPLPPLAAEYLTTSKAPHPEAKADESVSKLFRGADGSTRIDTGHKSVINKAGSPETILLDHMKKEAQIVKLAPPALALPKLPQMPGMPPPPPGPPGQGDMTMKHLGKKVMNGHEVEGIQYIFKPPKMVIPAPAPPPAPAMPAAGGPPGAAGAPKMAGAPAVPGMKLDMPKLDVPKLDAAKLGLPKLDAAKLGPPKLDAPKVDAAKLGAPKLDAPKLDAPKAPAAPPGPVPTEISKELPPAVTEVWTISKLKVPMMSKMTGSLGHETTMLCKNVVPGPPPPALFGIPPGYKLIKV